MQRIKDIIYGKLKACSCLSNIAGFQEDIAKEQGCLTKTKMLKLRCISAKHQEIVYPIVLYLPALSLRQATDMLTASGKKKATRGPSASKQDCFSSLARA